MTTEDEIMPELNTTELDGTIFISDNLPFLKALDTESVDLVCIDPPFGKKQTFVGNLNPPLSPEEMLIERELMDSWGAYDPQSAYEVGIEYPDQSGMTANFEDIWDFRVRVYKDWFESLQDICPSAYWLIQATRYTHSEGIAAYIAFMVERVLEMRRILKPTGSIYLHCDHTANAYLRQMMDAVFGPDNFLNEITWQRVATKKGNLTRGLANDTDTILRYGKNASKVVWNADAVTTPYDPDNLPETIAKKYTHSDPDGRLWSLTSITSLSQNSDPSKTFEVMGVTRTWRWKRERIEQEIANGRIIQMRPGAVPRYKRYLDEQRGLTVNNLWTDINNLNSMARERTGYPTQKPQALARRIIEMSTNPGDIVLDCFAGCAYVPVAAQVTGRRWIACDMSPRAWTIVRRQFHKHQDLGIVTEGEIAADGNGVKVNPKLETANRIIKVRGPNQLPVRTTEDVQEPLPTRSLPRPQYKVRPYETDQQIWDAFVDQYGTSCWYCGAETRRDRRELHLDHIEPNKRDGTNNDCWNRALACSPCNSDKSNKLTPAETIAFALKQGRISTLARSKEVKATFAARRQWAKDRWERVRPRTGREDEV